MSRAFTSNDPVEVAEFCSRNVDMRAQALDETIKELVGTRQERDRYMARCQELEARLDAIRKVAK